jgi:hypothetical protein
MSICEFVFTGKSGKWKGVDICTLTGNACPIEDEKRRGNCDKLLFARQYLSKHPQEANS